MTDEACERFDAYDFEHDEKFTAGLQSICKDSDADTDKLFRAKIFYFNRFKETLTIDDYLSWSKKNDTSSAESCTTVQAPTSQPVVDDSADQDSTPSQTTESQQAAPKVTTSSGLSAQQTSSLEAHVVTPAVASVGDIAEKKSGDSTTTNKEQLSQTVQQDQPCESASPKQSDDAATKETSDDLTKDQLDLTDTRPADAQNSLTLAEVMEYVQAGKEIPSLEKLDISAINEEPTDSSVEIKKKPWQC